MPGFFSYVPVADLAVGRGTVTLLRSAATKSALRANRSYDPDQAGSIDASQVTDTGDRDVVHNSKTGSVVAAAICAVS